MRQKRGFIPGGGVNPAPLAADPAEAKYPRTGQAFRHALRADRQSAPVFSHEPERRGRRHCHLAPSLQRLGLNLRQRRPHFIRARCRLKNWPLAKSRGKKALQPLHRGGRGVLGSNTRRGHGLRFCQATTEAGLKEFRRKPRSIARRVWSECNLSPLFLRRAPRNFCSPSRNPT